MQNTLPPEPPETVEENEEVRDDKDAPPEQPIAIELPIEPADADGQPT